MEFSTRFPYSEMELSTLFPRYFRDYHYFINYRDFHGLEIGFPAFGMTKSGNHGNRCTYDDAITLSFFSLPPRKRKRTVHHALWFRINSLFRTFRKRESLEVQRNLGNSI